VVGIGGAATAAYTGHLPAPVQHLAHDTIGAPDGHSHPSASPSPVGPDATGHAAFGLCTAWEHAQKDGSKSEQAVAFRNLEHAAGGAASVPAYCKSVQHPGKKGAHPTGQPTSHPTGRPTSHPGGQPTSHPTGRPTSHPTGQPTSHPTGRPSSVPAG
jgi:hypothetical protein